MLGFHIDQPTPSAHSKQRPHARARLDERIAELLPEVERLRQEGSLIGHLCSHEFILLLFFQTKYVCFKGTSSLWFYRNNPIKALFWVPDTHCPRQCKWRHGLIRSEAVKKSLCSRFGEERMKIHHSLKRCILLLARRGKPKMACWRSGFRRGWHFLAESNQHKTHFPGSSWRLESNAALVRPQHDIFRVPCSSLAVQSFGYF